MMYSDELLARIKDANDIVDIVGSRVELNSNKACCPLHNEKTASFYVSSEEQYFHCFGCQASGDVIGFIQEYEGVDFPTAVEFLADKAGIEVVQTANTYQHLYTNEEKKTDFYYSNLTRNHNVINYLKSRGITGQSAARYKLGAHGDAVMFPIRDVRGRTLGFTKRFLNPVDDMPKSINSKDSEIFNKKKVVYGLYELKQQVRKPDNIIVVEGQIDAIKMHQAGFQNTVATLGTAITTEQLKLVFRYTNEIIICCDGDRAGRKATQRALLNALPLIKGKRIVYVAQLPEGKDPDDIVSENVDNMREILSNRISAFDGILLGYKIRSDRGVFESEYQQLEYLSKYTKMIKEPLLRELFISKISQITKIKEDKLDELMR